MKQLKRQIEVSELNFLRQLAEKIGSEELAQIADRLDTTYQHKFVEIPERQDSARPRCSAPGCLVDWRIPDSSMLLINGSWLCRQHHPTTEVSQHIGWTPPQDKLTELEEKRKSALGKISRDELRLLNSRI